MHNTSTCTNEILFGDYLTIQDKGRCTLCWVRVLKKNFNLYYKRKEAYLLVLVSSHRKRHKINITTIPRHMDINR